MYFPQKNSTMDSLICDLHFNLAKHWLIDINGFSGLEIDFYSETQTFFLCVDFCYHRTMIVFAVIMAPSFINKRALQATWQHTNYILNTQNIFLILIFWFVHQQSPASTLEIHINIFSDHVMIDSLEFLFTFTFS